MPIGRAIRNSVRTAAHRPTAAGVPGGRIAMLLLAPGTSRCHEAHPPTKEAPAGKSPRIPRPHVESRRRQGHQSPPSERPSSVDADRKPALPVASPSWALKRHSRLLRSADFDRTLRSGRRAASAYLAVFVSDNELGRPRVGLAVSRKLGNAVVRNRIKRRLRELGRPLVTRAKGGRDVVIVARARASDAEFARLRQEIEMLWAKSWGQ